MKLNINVTLRKLRQEKGVTQEELASAIGVTMQAVSKWERDEGYPDITLLPNIARYFGVTLDTLCGIDQLQQDEEISSIVKSAMYASYEDGVRIAREGLAKFPYSIKLKKLLAETLLGCTGSWTPPKEVLNEVISLYEDIIQHCTDMELRNNAISSLCHVYELSGDHKKAEETAQQIFGKYERQRAWCQILNGEELVDHVQNSIIQTMPDIYFMLKNILETDCYTAKEKITLCQKMIAIHEIIDECHEWPVGMLFSYMLYCRIAVLCVKLGDINECLNALNNAADLAVRIDSLPSEGFPSSLLLNRISFEYLYGSHEKEGLRNDIESESAFETIREMPEYKMIMEKLK